MRKVLDLKDGCHYVCKFDEKATENPYRLYLSSYVVDDDGIPHHRERQVGRFGEISEVLYALASVKSAVTLLKSN